MVKAAQWHSVSLSEFECSWFESDSCTQSGLAIQAYCEALVDLENAGCTGKWAVKSIGEWGCLLVSCSKLVLGKPNRSLKKPDIR